VLLLVLLVLVVVVGVRGMLVEGEMVEMMGDGTADEK